MANEILDEVGPEPEESLAMWVKVICVLSPLVALFVYLNHKDKAPLKAKSASTLGWIGLGISILLRVIAFPF